MNIWRRRLSALSWFVVAAVLARAGSGGGGGGIQYVADVEPPLSYAAGVVVLAVSLALVLAFASSHSTALPVLSAVASIPTAAYGGYLAHSHDSALALSAAAIGAFVLAAPAARRQFVGRRADSTSRRNADEVEQDR